MSHPVELLSAADPIRAAVLFLAAWWLKGAAILALAWLASRLLARRAAAARHLAWTLTVAAVLSVPVVSLLLPSLDVPLPEGVFAPAPPPELDSVAQALPDRLGGGAVRAGSPAAETVLPADAGHAVYVAGEAGDGVSMSRGEGAGPITLSSLVRGVDWSGVALSFWLAGVILLLLRSASDRLARRRVVREAVPAPDDWRALVDGAPASLRVRRPVRLLVSAAAPVPMTWGVLRPFVVLPAGARAWTRPRLRDALFHELAHVGRLDVLWQASAELLSVLAWVDPLVWIGRRRLCREAEHACDDAVLAAGIAPSLYAGHLLEAARGLKKRRAARLPAAAVAMARPSGLSERIGAVLDGARRRDPVRGGQVALCALAAVVLALPVAALAPHPAAAAPAPAPSASPAPPSAGAASVAAATSGFSGTVNSSSSTDEPTEGYFTQPRYRGHCEPGLLTGRTYGNQVNARDDHWKIALYHASCSLEIELDGDIRFSADDRGIERMGRGAELTIEEHSDTPRKVVVTAGPGGEPRFRYTVDGDDRPFDAAGRSWLAEVLPEVFRTTGLQAPERVARLLSEGGVPAVLAEIRLMSSDRVQGLYFDQVLGQRSLSPPEAEAFLRTAGETIGSDHSLGELLSRFPSAPLAAPRVQAAFVEAAATIGSDHEAGRVLKTLLGRGDLAPATVDAVMPITEEIGSDHELAEVLLALLEAGPRDRPVSPAFFAAADTIGSDHEQGRVLRAVIDRGHLDDATVQALLASAEKIGSDHELAEMLVLLASRTGLDGPLRARYLETAKGIGSRHDHDRALAAVGEPTSRGR